MSTSTLIETPAAQDERATLLVGFELGKSSWLIGLYAPERGKTVSRHKIDGGDLGKVVELIAAMRRRLEKLGKPVRVVSIYEAGYERVVAASRAAGGRRRQPGDRCGERSGGPAGAPRQDRPPRSRAVAADAAGAGARRDTGLPGGAGAEPGRRGRQASAS